MKECRPGQVPREASQDQRLPDKQSDNNPHTGGKEPDRE